MVTAKPLGMTVPAAFSLFDWQNCLSLELADVSSNSDFQDEVLGAAEREGKIVHKVQRSP
jgi:hypothetical protein